MVKAVFCSHFGTRKIPATKSQVFWNWINTNYEKPGKKKKSLIFFFAFSRIRSTLAKWPRRFMNVRKGVEGVHIVIELKGREMLTLR